METWTWRHGHGDMDMVQTVELKYRGILTFQQQKMENGTQAIFLIHLTFAHRANGSLSFVRLLTKKQMEVIHLQTE
jgi:hypothetical protein